MAAQQWVLGVVRSFIYVYSPYIALNAGIEDQKSMKSADKNHFYNFVNPNFLTLLESLNFKTKFSEYLFPFFLKVNADASL